MEEELFDLSEIDVVTVGLVDEGAVGEDFYLMKRNGNLEEYRDDDNMWNEIKTFVKNVIKQEEKEDEDETEDEETQEEKPEGDKIITEEEVEESDEEKAVMKAIETLSPYRDTLPGPARRALFFLNQLKVQALKSVGGIMSDELEVKDTEMENIEEEVVEKIEVEPEVVVEKTDEKPKPVEIVAEVKPVAVDVDAIAKAVSEQVLKSQESQIVELTKRLEATEKRAADAEEQKEKRELVEKARTDFDNMPEKYTVIGEALFSIKKTADEEVYDTLYGILKASNTQLKASGIWNETGTSQSPEELELLDKVEKASAEKPIAEVILSMSETEQAELLSDMRRGGK